MISGILGVLIFLIFFDYVIIIAIFLLGLSVLGFILKLIIYFFALFLIYWKATLVMFFIILMLGFIGNKIKGSVSDTDK